jgi:hypothetical protein
VPEEWDIVRIRSESGDQNAHFVDGQMRAAIFDKPLRVKRALDVGGHFLIETEDEPDNWYMGEMAKDGTIECWGQYGTLANAIHGL